MKYFTPDISDIRVGYECECLWSCQEPRPWWPIKVLEEDMRDTRSLPIEEVYWRIENNEIRVPYLTKEQIEAEGWERGIASDYLFKMKKSENGNDYEVRVYPKDLPDTLIISSNDSYIYTGECKDINTFRYISKLLQI
jgi:hypothetical protein